MLTLDQVRNVSAALAVDPSSYVSVCAGRIADTEYDPVPLMSAAVQLVNQYNNQELIWAIPRELLTIFQANSIGCHTITATNDILRPVSIRLVDTVKDDTMSSRPTEWGVIFATCKLSGKCSIMYEHPHIAIVIPADKGGLACQF